MAVPPNPTQALIHMSHLRHNVRRIRGRVGESVAICAAVKANGYGHDAVLVARAVQQAGVEALGVANTAEGVSLRNAGIGGTIYVFGNPLQDEMAETIRHDLIPFLADDRSIISYAAEARRQHTTAKVHLKIDTGMGRIGCDPAQAEALAALIDSSPDLTLAGVCTHFAGSDMADQSYTEHQIAVFAEVLDTIRARGIDPGIVHASNTGGLLGFPDAGFAMVRVGIALYGYYPSDEQARDMDLKPVMELVTRVAFIKTVPAGVAISYGMTYTTDRPTTIATLPVGYADGYSRLLSNRADVLIKGKRYPIVGRVCMDQCMVDLGPETDIGVGDRVVLFGPEQQGPDAEELGRLMGTIPYEVTCLITGRVPRVAEPGEDKPTVDRPS